jgi:hypothetical protein
MAVSNVLAPTKYALVLAAFFIVFLGLEVDPVDAGGCDSNAVMGQMGSCMGLNSKPAYGSPCCNAMNYVKNTIQPDDNCICNLAHNPSLSGVGLDASKITDVIQTCVGAYAVPSCLWH